jgi:hypothetical protein
MTDGGVVLYVLKRIIIFIISYHFRHDNDFVDKKLFQSKAKFTSAKLEQLWNLGPFLPFGKNNPCRIIYCFIGMKNRLLVVKCYSSSLVSGFQTMNWSPAPYLIFIVSLLVFILL